MALTATDLDFLRAIAAAPFDDRLRLVYADWLEDQGDPRAEYLRLEVEATREEAKTSGREALTDRLKALESRVAPVWLRHRTGELWLVRYEPGHKIAAIKLTRNLTGWGLLQCVDNLEQVAGPWLLRSDVSWYELVLKVRELNQEYPGRVVFEARLTSAFKEAEA
jgi:uncharacterized protein (TIGR02996 family)